MLRAAHRQTIFVIVFLIVVVLFVFTFRLGVVRGSSMTPTYQNGQTVLVRRRNWFNVSLHRNDVVLLSQGRDVIIKRVYRLPGEELDDSHPYRLISRAFQNGMSDYYEQKIEKTPLGPRPRLFVPDGYLVVLGDNVTGSEDSRIFGPVPLKSVIGVVVGSPDPPYAATSRPDLGSPNNAPL